MAERLNGSSSGSLYPLTADITREDDLKKAFQWIEDNLGGVAAIINNAGVVRMTPIEGIYTTL